MTVVPMLENKEEKGKVNIKIVDPTRFQGRSQYHGGNAWLQTCCSGCPNETSKDYSSTTIVDGEEIQTPDRIEICNECVHKTLDKGYNENQAFKLVRERYKIATILPLQLSYPQLLQRPKIQ